MGFQGPLSEARIAILATGDKVDCRLGCSTGPKIFVCQWISKPPCTFFPSVRYIPLRELTPVVELLHQVVRDFPGAVAGVPAEFTLGRNKHAISTTSL